VAAVRHPPAIRAGQENAGSLSRLLPTTEVSVPASQCSRSPKTAPCPPCPLPAAACPLTQWPSHAGSAACTALCSASLCSALPASAAPGLWDGHSSPHRSVPRCQSRVVPKSVTTALGSPDWALSSMARPVLVPWFVLAVPGELGGVRRSLLWLGSACLWQSGFSFTRAPVLTDASPQHLQLHTQTVWSPKGGQTRRCLSCHKAVSVSKSWR